MKFFAILIAIALVLTGCGNQYITGSPIPSETMTKIETVVDAILNDNLTQHQELVMDVAKTINEDIFVDGASAVLGWRFKEGKYVVKMFPELFPKNNLDIYNAVSYEEKMEEFLVPGAKKCYNIILQAAQEAKNGGDL